MTIHHKPLHPYEQSMLLVAMLFDSKNLNQTLSFFPVEQAERVSGAQEKFMELSRNERMTQIVFELRRLLLIDEHRIDWIHPSWFAHALAQEPAYLRPIIEQAMLRCSLNPREHQGLIPLPLIFSAFIQQLIKTPQKIAIYDLVLMRLQSLKDETSDEKFSELGRASLLILMKMIPKKRWVAYIEKMTSLDCNIEIDESVAMIFMASGLRNFFIQELWRYRRKNIDVSMATFAGIITCAVYLKSFKSSWQRSIALGLNKSHGALLLDLLERAPLFEDAQVHQSLAQHMITAMDR